MSFLTRVNNTNTNYSLRLTDSHGLQLKPKQEIELKVKNFIPPFSAEPEIYLLEVLPSEEPSMLLSLSPLSPLPHHHPFPPREETPPHICHDFCHHSRAQKRTSQFFKLSIVN